MNNFFHKKIKQQPYYTNYHLKEHFKTSESFDLTEIRRTQQLRPTAEWQNSLGNAKGHL